MKRLGFIMALGAVSAWSIDIPRIGFARDSHGYVYPVNGVAGNFIQGDPIAGDAAIAFSWNGSFGIRKTDSAVEWWDNSGARLATIDAPPGDAVIGFGDLQTAWIYLKSSQTLSAVKLNQWTMQPLAADLSDGEVLALAGHGDSVDVAVRRLDGVFLLTFDSTSGSRTSVTPLKSASQVLLLSGGAIAGTDGSTIRITRSDGSDWSVDTGTSLSGLAWMGREWIQVSSADCQFALRIRPGTDPALYTLPQVVPE